MDFILNKLKDISITTRKNDIDDLIDKIDNITVYDPDLEWKKLNDNYNKLKYFNNTVIGNNDPVFIKVFSLFMDKIEEMNKNYISNIILDPDHYNSDEYYNFYTIDEVKQIIQLISDCLYNSFEMDDPYKKMENTLTAYSHMISLVEDMRSEFNITGQSKRRKKKSFS